MSVVEVSSRTWEKILWKKIKVASYILRVRLALICWARIESFRKWFYFNKMFHFRFAPFFSSPFLNTFFLSIKTIRVWESLLKLLFTQSVNFEKEIKSVHPPDRPRSAWYCLDISTTVKPPDKNNSGYIFISHILKSKD